MWRKVSHARDRASHREGSEGDDKARNHEESTRAAITWRQAADLLGICERHVRRLRLRAERDGVRALTDGRSQPRRKRIPEATIRELCRLRRELYAARGKYRRKRERRPMAGMMLHLDASTHLWIEGLRNHDLVVMLDDATGEILYAGFFEQEGVVSTLDALKYVLARHRRFCELYTNRGSHFCNTKVAKEGPDQIQQGPVPRALKALGIRHIWAYSPQARGRSERAFGTLQGRLPQELKLAGIQSYAAANRYLERVFISAYNRRFAVPPAQPDRAFTPLPGIDLDLVLSIQHQRTVHNDNTVLFGKTFLQLPPSPDRLHHARCQVTVHELVDGVLAVSFQGKPLGRFSPAGKLRIQEHNGKEKGRTREAVHRGSRGTSVARKRTSLTAYGPDFSKCSEQQKEQMFSPHKSTRRAKARVGSRCPAPRRRPQTRHRYLNVAPQTNRTAQSGSSSYARGSARATGPRGRPAAFRAARPHE